MSSEADYMDDCQQLDRHDFAEATHEVTIDGKTVFQGTRADCWDYKRRNGGWVQEVNS